MKKINKSLLIISSAIILGACSNDMAPGDESTNEDVLVASNVSLLKASGIFEGEFEDNFIDVNINGVKKMYRYVSDVSGVVEKLNEEDKITFAYEQTEKGEYVIHMITAIDNKSINQKSYKTSNENENNNEEEDEFDFSKYENKGTIFDVDIQDGYILIGNTIYYKKNTDFKVKIETLSYDTEIRKERWAAASIIEEVGSLKELVNNYVPGTNFERAEFIFAGYGEDETKYVAVKWNNNELYRFTMEVPFEEDYEKIEIELWNMISEVNLKN